MIYFPSLANVIDTHDVIEVKRKVHLSLLDLTGSNQQSPQIRSIRETARRIKYSSHVYLKPLFCNQFSANQQHHQDYGSSHRPMENKQRFREAGFNPRLGPLGK
jgi:hypothetical protein